MSQGSTLQALLARSGQTLRSATDKELGEHVDALVKRSADYKSQVLARPWMRSLAFFLGYQHIMWSSRTRRFFPLPLKPEDRHTVNVYRSHAMNMVSAFTSHRPKFSVIPEEASSESRSDARPAELILANIWTESRFTTRNILGAVQRALFGGTWWRSRYDPDLGDVEKNPIYAMDLATGVKILDDQGQSIQLVDGKGLPRFEWTEPIGEVRAENLSVFEVYWPTAAPEPIVDGLRWVATRTPVPCAELKLKWGLDIASQPEAVDPLQAMQLGLGADLGRYLSPERFAEALWSWEGEESAYETVIHLPHSSEKGYEGGLALTVVDGRVVDRAEGWLDTGHLPFEYQPTIPVPGRLAGDTACFDMQDPQMQYNWALSDVAGMRRASAMPYMIYPANAINPQDFLSGKRMIERRSGVDQSPIQQIETGRVSSATVAEVNTHLTNIDRTASQFGPSRGEMMGASPQPVGTMQLMQKADLSDLQPGMDIADEAQGRLGGKLLALVRQHYSRERLALVTTDDAGDVAGFMYSRSSLPKRLRVVIRPKSSLGDTNKDALRANFAEIAKSGILGAMTTDPKFQEYLLELMDMPAPEQLLVVGNLGYRRQEREIEEMLATMKPLPLGPFDKNPEHLAVIERLTNTSRWDEIGPQAQQVIMAHANLHQQDEQMKAQMQMQAQMQQAQMMAMSGAAPAGPTETPTGLPIQ